MADGANGVGQPKRLRTLLAARGLIRPEDHDLHDNRVVFNAAAAEATARQITDKHPEGGRPGAARPRSRRDRGAWHKM